MSACLPSSFQVETLQARVNDTDGIEVTLRNQALFFDFKELEALDRPVTDYCIRGYHRQTVPKKIPPLPKKKKYWLFGPQV